MQFIYLGCDLLSSTISSPEHKGLKVSYCDHSPSGIHPNLLLWNYWYYFKIISQECLLVGLHQKLFKEFNSNYNLDRCSTEKGENDKSFKNLLIQFQNMFAKMFLEWPICWIVKTSIIFLSKCTGPICK